MSTTHERAIEMRADESVGIQQAVVSHVAQAGAEPGFERHAETDLSPIDDRLGQVASSDLLQHPLRDPVVHLDRGGQRERELDEPWIEERRTKLEAGRHRHPVSALEEVVGQPGVKIGAEHLVDDVGAGRRVRSEPR